MTNILLVEDDQETASELVNAMNAQGWNVDHVVQVSQGLKHAASNPYDLIVLDRMLPDDDGLTLVQRLHELQITIPVLVLSALGESAHKVEGLDVGADDYLAKPFSADELFARVRALLRRSAAGPHPEVLVIEDLEIWVKARNAVRNGRNLDLTDTEFNLLHYLAVNEGETVTRRMILENVFNVKFDPGTNVVEVHVSRLRRKLDQKKELPLLRTVRGRGYVLNAKA
jgi:two-component system OmpR family response regulator